MIRAALLLAFIVSIINASAQNFLGLTFEEVLEFTKTKCKCVRIHIEPNYCSFQDLENEKTLAFDFDENLCVRWSESYPKSKTNELLYQYDELYERATNVGKERWIWYYDHVVNNDTLHVVIEGTHNENKIMFFRKPIISKTFWPIDHPSITIEVLTAFNNTKKAKAKAK